MNRKYGTIKYAGQVFIGVYSKLTIAPIPRLLMNFYKIKRACLRAYLVARHIEEPHYQHDPTWLTKANANLQLAENYYQQLAT